MNDSSVAPTGLFNPRRQRQLIDGIISRFQSCQDQRQTFIDRHHVERTALEDQLTQARALETQECRQQRRSTLAKWDAVEEDVLSSYESQMVEVRTNLNRNASLFRKQLADAKATIERKLDARTLAITQQYESQRHQPGEQQKRENDRIASALLPLNENLTWARDLTVRRLDQLPTTKSVETSQQADPESVEQSINTIQQISQRVKELATELQTGTSAKLVDSFYLPIFVAVLCVVWVAGVLMTRPSAFWPIMVGGVVVSGLLGFVIYAALLIPLRQKTRRIYPLVEQCGKAAEQASAIGQQIAAQHAREASEELIQHRETQLAAARHWKEQQLDELTSKLATQQEAAKRELTHRLASLDGELERQYKSTTSEMHEQAEQVAAEITARLTQTDEQLDRDRNEQIKSQLVELQRVTDRLRTGVTDGLNRIRQCKDAATQRFPDWHVLASGMVIAGDRVDFVPIGDLRVDRELVPVLTRVAPTHPSKDESDAAQTNGQSSVVVPPIFQADEIPPALPVALHRRLHSGMIVRAAANQMQAATQLVHQVLWLMLSGTSGGRTELTLIDPVGRGQNFTAFMSLTDHDPALVGHRVWTTETQIESRLGEIAQHAEDVLQSSLRDRFQRIEDYNEIAGSMAEPYRVVAAIDFPEGLTRSGYKHLMALVESGQRCGVMVLIVCRDDQPWPNDLPMPVDHRLLRCNVDNQGQWTVMDSGLERLPFEPAPDVPVESREQLIQQIGQAAAQAARVEVPLAAVLPEFDTQQNTDDGLQITIGSQGGERTLALALGEGVRQHVLIAGKTGSGKSTLLHSIITSGAKHYTPDQLNFYLLDFKKGVEFKAYADHALPHARVIGIESEREFGRSVLERLDSELQERGELFRGVSAQELSEYRSSSGKSMPRIVLVVDEFQELFVRDDRVAAECSMLLDRLVRQGRSFGMHVILSSQSLAGAYSLPRATLGQMAVRIAMQCSESDAALILSDENTAARLITRPGEAIYNDAGGLIEGNQPFQVAWLSSEDHQTMLQQIATRDQDFAAAMPPPVVFEGNRPCRWTPALANAAISLGQPSDASGATLQCSGLLGEAIEIGPPVALSLTRNAGRNVMMIPAPEARAGLLGSVLSGFAKQHSDLELVYFDGNRAGQEDSLMPWFEKAFEKAGLSVRNVKPRDSEPEMVKLAALIKQRDEESNNNAPIIIVIDPLDRFRDLRNDDSFRFSLDADADQLSGGQALCEVLKEGPPVNVFSILICGSAEIVGRWLPRQAQHDLELRVLGRLNASDSSLLIDSPLAAELSDATMLLYDEPVGRIQKFRQPSQPDAGAVRQWLQQPVSTEPPHCEKEKPNAIDF
ncbi:MAG: FtsK/SpoIIIE domain-containing protein [Planctomycetota bacterium]